VRTTVAFYPPPVYHPDAVGAAGRENENENDENK